MLEGNVAVVTGGGRGLGRVIATAIADAGGSVAICGRSREPLDETVAAIRDTGGDAVAVTADVTREADVAGLHEAVMDHFGRVDVLVNNSGITGPSAPLWEVDPAAWDETVAVNVRGVFLASRAFVPGMVARGSGSVVNIGSMTGKRALNGRSAYAATKTALIGLTRTLAHEAGPFGVRVNLVSPGGIEGPRIERVIRNLAAREGIDEDRARSQFTDGSPLRRLVPASDVAAAVVFLASDAAASITGEDLNVSAGLVMY